MKVIYFTIFCCCLFDSYYSQIGELDRFDCNYSKEITVPFNFSETQTPTKPQLNQVVFYSFRDQFTYWYKITAKSNGKLNFTIAAINDSDSYAVYLYQYNASNFCNKLYSKKIKAINTPYYVGLGGDLLNVKQNTFNLIKDSIYYISVLNTSLNNCGHTLKLNFNFDTLNVKALHIPCKKDITSIYVSPKAIKTPLKKDTNSVKIPKTDIVYNDTAKQQETKIKTEIVTNLVTIFTKDKKNLNLINATLFVVNADTKELVLLTKNSIGKWEMVLDNTKAYKVKCIALGYKDLQIPLDNTKSNIMELLLEPLKIGDNFIMKSIYFHPNTYALRKESSEDLQKLLNYLKDNATVIIEIQGHTNGDNRIFKNKANEQLSEEWNFKGSSKNLSLKRAEAIKNYLINNGIEQERLVPIGKGGSKPIIESPETMEEGQRNIRVEVVILKN